MKIRCFKQGHIWRIELGCATYDSKFLIGAFLRLIWFKIIGDLTFKLELFNYQKFFGFNLTLSVSAWRKLHFVYRKDSSLVRWGYQSDHHKHGERIFNLGRVQIGLILIWALDCEYT